MTKVRILSVVFGLAVAGLASVAPAAMQTDAAVAAAANPGRLREIAAMLPEHPQWPLEHTKGSSRVADACFNGLPDTSDDSYLGYSRTGKRWPYQSDYFQLTEYMLHCAAVYADTNDRKYLVKACEILNVLCKLKSWCLPAHDTDLSIFNGQTVRIDLGSSSTTCMIAETLVLLKGKIPAELEQRVRAELDRRSFAVYREIRNATKVSGPQLKGNFWFYTKSNWNAVCHANMIVAALALIEDRNERAAYVEAGERGMRFFLESFLDDGYCTEGMGYWNYGYGHFLKLVFAVKKATGDKVDYSRSPRAPRALAYAFGYRLDERHCPSFADGGGGQPGSKYLEQGCQLWPQFKKIQEGELSLRDFFPCAMVYVGRSSRMQIGLKGGNNNELHNHNDIGSWTLVVDGVEIAGDPGHEEYTAKTFGPHRYESQLLNSYGHPVPVIAGDLQGTGARYCGSVVETNFTDKTDSFTLDLSAAYPMVDKKLGTCRRKLELLRKKDHDRITIADILSVKRKIAFETPFVTSGKCTMAADRQSFTVEKSEGPRSATIKVKVGVKAGEAKWHLEEKSIPNPGKPDVHRIAVVFDEPVDKAMVGWRISPQ